MPTKSGTALLHHVIQSLKTQEVLSLYGFFSQNLGGYAKPTLNTFIEPPTHAHLIRSHRHNLATVVIGGLISATLLTLFVLPTLYARFGQKVIEKPEHYNEEHEGDDHGQTFVNNLA